MSGLNVLPDQDTPDVASIARAGADDSHLQHRVVPPSPRLSMLSKPADGPFAGMRSSARGTQGERVVESWPDTSVAAWSPTTLLRLFAGCRRLESFSRPSVRRQGGVEDGGSEVDMEMDMAMHIVVIMYGGTSVEMETLTRCLGTFGQRKLYDLHGVHGSHGGLLDPTSM